ncbi:MAG: TfuA-like protein [Actinomycetota bacterium]|nr:TfuA-like protein [Actinomycetota bacterium]
MSRPVVFVGPTLTRDAVARVLDADVRGPAAAGDVARAAAHRPAAILVIDGIYERTPAVGHKEVLWALSEGVAVYGAASMGALRAAELDRFGMIGVGEVYRQLRDGQVIADDAVAVAHLGAEHDHRPTTVALVDIVAALDDAVAAGVVEAADARALIGAARALHYTERIWPSVLERAAAELRPEVVGPLRTWLRSGTRSQKADDARAALERVRADLDAGPVTPPPRDWELARTVHWRRVETSLGLSSRGPDGRATVGQATRGHSVDDRTAGVLEAVRRSDDYVETYQRALLQRLASELARQHGVDLDPVSAMAELRTRLGLIADDTFAAWLDANDLDADRCARLALDQAATAWADERYGDDAAAQVADVLRIRGRYAPLAADAGERVAAQDPRDAGDGR